MSKVPLYGAHLSARKPHAQFTHPEVHVTKRIGNRISVGIHSNRAGVVWG